MIPQQKECFLREEVLSLLNLGLEVSEEGRHVDVASADHAAHLLPLEAAVLEHCRHHGRRGGLYHDLHALQHQLRCRHDLLLTHQDHVLGSEVLAQDGECQRAETGAQAIRDGDGWQLPHNLALLEGEPGIAGEEGLDAHGPALAAEVAGAEHAATAEPSSAYREDKVVKVRPLLEDLLGRSGLAGDDVEVVVGVHEEGAVLLAHAVGGLLALLERVSGLDDVAAIAENSCLLDLGGVGGHDDVGGEAEGGGGVGEGLRVVARGVRADGGDGGVELEQFVEGAPRLEGAHLLEVLALEQQLLAAGHRRDAAARQQRRPVHVLPDALVSGLDRALRYHAILISHVMQWK